MALFVVARHWPNRATICFFLDEVTGWWQKGERTQQGRAQLTTGQKNDFSWIHYCRFAGTIPGGGDTCPQRQRKADDLVRGQPGLGNELKNCQKYTEILCLEKNQKKKSQNKTEKVVIVHFLVWLTLNAIIERMNLFALRQVFTDTTILRIHMTRYNSYIMNFFY